MFSKTTDNIRVSVLPNYDEKNSNPSENRFLFKYFINIENFSQVSIKILKRTWTIYDVGYGFSEVGGNGVIGLTPTIKPLEDFAYFSNVFLRSGMGHMQGTYVIEDLESGDIRTIEIPKFYLMATLLSN